MNARRKPYMLTNQNSTAFWLIGNLWMPLATSHHTQDNFSLMEQICGTEVGGPQSHMHPTDEGMYIMEGHLTFQVGGEKIKAGPGTFASIPRYTEHSFTIDEPATRVLNFYTPGGFELFIMALGAPAQERRAPEAGETTMPPTWMVLEASREFGQLAAPTMPIADPPTAHRETKPSQVNETLPFSTQKDEAPAIWFEDSLITILAASEQTGGTYSLLHQSSPKGSGPAPHTHAQDEGIYVLDGTLTILADGEHFIANAGSFVYLPAATVHTFRVDSTEAALLNWYLPGGFERVLERAGTPTALRTIPTTRLSSGLNAEQLGALLDHLGTTLVLLPDTLRSAAM